MASARNSADEPPQQDKQPQKVTVKKVPGSAAKTASKTASTAEAQHSAHQLGARSASIMARTTLNSCLAEARRRRTRQPRCCKQFPCTRCSGARTWTYSNERVEDGFLIKKVAANRVLSLGAHYQSGRFSARCPRFPRCSTDSRLHNVDANRSHVSNSESTARLLTQETGAAARRARCTTCRLAAADAASRYGAPCWTDPAEPQPRPFRWTPAAAHFGSAKPRTLPGTLTTLLRPTLLEDPTLNKILVDGA